jgi:hypothetical protein
VSVVDADMYNRPDSVSRGISFFLSLSSELSFALWLSIWHERLKVAGSTQISLFRQFLNAGLEGHS